jgi:hypothetical protein
MPSLVSAEIAISTSTQVSPTEILDVAKADPTDDCILECAVAAGSPVMSEQMNERSWR